MINDGRYADAEAAARAFLAERAAAGETGTPDVEAMTRALVESLHRGGKSKAPETTELARRDLDLSRRLFGETSAEHADSLANLANLAFRTADYDTARDAYTRALAIKERVFGEKSGEVALALNGLASVEGVTGHFDACRSYLERALAIQEEVLGSDSLPVAYIRHNFAAFLYSTGDLVSAVEEAEKAVAIRSKLLPPDHALTALSIQNLALYKTLLGDSVGAELLYERALGMQERSLGDTHDEVALTLANLAGMLAGTGRLEEARIDFERSNAIFEKTSPDKHQFLALGRIQLAQILARLGEVDRARTLMSGAIASLVSTFGENQQDVGKAVLALADLESSLGETEDAASNYRRAIAIYEKVYGPDHPYVSTGLVGLAEQRLDAADFDAAEPLLRRALAIRETVLGPGHPDVARVRVGLARVARGRGDARAAIDESLRAEEILRVHFDHLLTVVSERQALDYERVRASGIGVALSAIAAPRAPRPAGAASPPSTGIEGSDPGDVGRVWESLAGSRALVLDRMAARHRVLVSSEAPESKRLARALAAATNRFASLVVKGPDPDRPEAYRKAVDEAAAERERIEREIAGRSVAVAPSFAPGSGRAEAAAAPVDAVGGSPDSAGVSMARLRGALPPGAALLAYVQYVRPEERSAPSYAALVLRSDGAAPRFFELGSAAAIDGRIADWMAQATSPGPAASGGVSELKYRDAGAIVRKRIWDPLAPALAGAGLVLIVPDGSINLVNFAALPDADRGYLIERGPLVHYLSAERDLLRHAALPKARPGGLVMGGPDFDALPAQEARGVDTSAPPAVAQGPAGPPQVASATAVPVYRGPTPECSDFRSLRFAPLPASLDEASEIEGLLKRPGAAAAPAGGATIRLTGALATEDAFKAMAQRSGLLHLATHGFYLGAGCDAGTGSRAAAPAAGAVSPAKPASVLEENPLLLSGVALAGANRRGDAAREGEDGILTAEEIASLDLSGVDWVVLSGCETARGSIRAGEGIFGLRRAFEVAGADTLILSLWKVEDRATLDWMKALYQRRGAGASTAQAVHDAGLAILQARRARGRSTHPFYWGAFVSAGDWR